MSAANTRPTRPGLQQLLELAISSATEGHLGSNLMDPVEALKLRRVLDPTHQRPVDDDTR